MKILVVSDTHRYLGNLKIALDQEGKIDMLIHAGDAEGDENYIRSMLMCPTLIVRGNNDRGGDLPLESTIDLYGVKIFITHGHKYAVRFDNELLINKAKKAGAEIVVFGHIHTPVLEKKDGVLIINPGSLTYPRQSGRLPSYAVLNINENGEVKAAVKYIEMKQ